MMKKSNGFEARLLYIKMTDAVFTVLRRIMIEVNPEIRIEIRDFGVFKLKRQKQNIEHRIQRVARPSSFLQGGKYI